MHENVIERNGGIIGVVGGMGPSAGVALVRSIYEQSLAICDSEQPNVLLYSMPGAIADRTDYILYQTGENPAFAVFEIVKRLVAAGAQHIGIPCNTFHSPLILATYHDLLELECVDINFVNIVKETITSLIEHHPNVSHVAVLGTLGTMKSDTYRKPLGEVGIDIFPIEAELQNQVHNLIYNQTWGLKRGGAIHPFALQSLQKIISRLKSRGVDCVILGCTELGLAAHELTHEEMNIIDSVRVLARALLREAAPNKLAISK